MHGCDDSRWLLLPQWKHALLHNHYIENVSLSFHVLQYLNSTRRKYGKCIINITIFNNALMSCCSVITQIAQRQGYTVSGRNVVVRIGRGQNGRLTFCLAIPDDDDGQNEANRLAIEGLDSFRKAYVESLANCQQERLFNRLYRTTILIIRSTPICSAQPTELIVKYNIHTKLLENVRGMADPEWLCMLVFRWHLNIVAYHCIGMKSLVFFHVIQKYARLWFAFAILCALRS